MKFHNYPGLESKLSNSMTFQVFQDRYEPCITIIIVFICIAELKLCSEALVRTLLCLYNTMLKKCKIKMLNHISNRIILGVTVLTFVTRVLCFGTRPNPAMRRGKLLPSHDWAIRLSHESKSPCRTCNR